ncbi:uncharacterized protein B0I36DRAFT_359562 [Microdochium trichocladiopsis]|uniref:Uncharacterized protein n=1 Tax=Microdochium trichocladiopsis TaxID=1682393 RepID=A0A9P8YBZ8_9PEZI|nr:uncharacterized protein B0I36DRAFT_359562 [Microdochium trichocladiopsis]KAH7037936.1 hypothetical protein B0I36DRAFT_359562 [Microdochium trichocladiopsis]
MAHEIMPGSFPAIQPIEHTTRNPAFAPATIRPPKTSQLQQALGSPTPPRSLMKASQSRTSERDLEDQQDEKQQTGISMRSMLAVVMLPQEWQQLGVKLCVLSSLLLHVGLLLGFQIAANKTGESTMTILMFVMTLLSGLLAMVIILAVEAATRGKKRLVALYPILGAMTGALLWLPIGGVEPAQQRAVPHEQWLHWMFLCAWLGFAAEFVFCCWRMLFREVLFQYLCTTARFS